MNNENTTPTGANEAATGEATYCPEDDKLRLYVGRVPREDYLALRAEGWTSTPKQDCDFVATWTAAREDTALRYSGGYIGDEDQSPADRAADRAERFAGYRDKRTGEALGHADAYDAGPSAHGYQNKARAVRAADRHDRQANRALNAWDKAEYWTNRTAGVISHALYNSRPDVRMGRIKKLESELRKAEKAHIESRQAGQAQFDALQSVIEHDAGTREKVRPAGKQDFLWALSEVRQHDGTPEGPATPEQIRRAVVASALSAYGVRDNDRARAKEAEEGTRPAAEIAREWLEGKARPADFDPEKGTRYTRHLRLRLAYERQMLEAQGGRAAAVEMVKGGTWQGGVIAKVNKSNATGRVVSVLVIVPRVDGWHYEVTNEPGTPHALAKFKTERGKPSDYAAPTPDSLAKLAEFEEARKAAAKKAPKAPPLLNPTDEDAARLQEIWNRDPFYRNDKPAEVLRMTQAEYSAFSKSFHGSKPALVVEGGTKSKRGGYVRESDHLEDVCKVRCDHRRVIVLTDKPQKPLPAACWETPVEDAREWCKANLGACFEAQTARTGGDPEKIEATAPAYRMMRRAVWASVPHSNCCKVSEDLQELFRAGGIYSGQVNA